MKKQWVENRRKRFYGGKWKNAVRGRMTFKNRFDSLRMINV